MSKIESIKRAADALVNDAAEDRSILDVYVSPLIIFLYRHAVELFLKDLLWQSHYLASEKKGSSQKNALECV